ncbi:MAG: c-type cytochrome [Gemmatimonadaceae bacterium]
MKVLRRLAVSIAVVVGLVVLLAGAVHVAAGRGLARHYDVVVPDPAEPVVDSALLARGAHLAGALGKCAECHGDDMGGKILVDDPAIGLLSVPNVTSGRGGVTSDFTLADWDRALRHGVRRDGTGLVLMPSEDYAVLTDDDFVALVSYLRQLPPVDREMPRPSIRLVGRALYLAGKLPLIAADRIDHTADRPVVQPDTTIEYGAYLADVGGCTGCHGPQLSGGPIPGMPPGTLPAANITPTGIGHYTEADFTRAMRDGVGPDGSRIDEPMPIRFTSQMTDDEILALYRYLRTVAPHDFGGR